MNNRQVRVLCFLYEDSGRDLHILLPVVYYAENYLNCKVEFEFATNIWAIRQKKPDLVLLPNTNGAPLYFRISKYAYQQNIPVFALISEGNFPDHVGFRWGWNIVDKTYYQEYICQWSRRTEKIFKDAIPEFKNKIVFTGATGFDRYKIYDFQSKREYCKTHQLPEYKKIIGYAGWSFGKLTNRRGREELLVYHRDNPRTFEWTREQRDAVEYVLKQIIENNPDILFVLKRHPKEAHEHIVQKSIKNEMSALEGYENVLYLKQKHEDIHNTLNVCDIWLGFDTTTVLEYWLLTNRPSILINPDPDFPQRKRFHEGSVVVKDYNTLQTYMDEYYKYGTITEFNKKNKVSNRQQKIHESIGYDDGLNHLRAGYYLRETIDKAKNKEFKPKFVLRYLIMHLYLKYVRYIYVRKIFENIPKFKKTIWIFERYKLKKIPQTKKKVYEYMDRFYEKHRLEEKMKTPQFWDQLFENKMLNV